MTASVRGRGEYYGEMQVDSSGDDEFTTSVHLTSVNDGSSIVRSGRSVVYGGYAWRGRSKGGAPTTASPDDLNSEAREVLVDRARSVDRRGPLVLGTVSGIRLRCEVAQSVRPIQRCSCSIVSSLKTGSQANRLRLIGDHLPARVTPADLDFGPGVTVRRIVSSTPSEVVAEVDVASDAALGKRDVAFRHSVLPGSYCNLSIASTMSK